MLPFSRRKLFEQMFTVIGLVLAFVKTYINWKNKSKYYSLSSLVLSVSAVSLITTAIITALFFLLHQIEQKWCHHLRKRGDSHPWQIRPAADCGISLLPLVPMALLIGLINFWVRCSELYILVTILCQGFLFTSVAFLWKTCDSFDNSLQSLVTVASISFVKVALVLWHLKLLGLVPACTVSFGSQLLFLFVLRALMSRCPKSFSIGEAVMVAQAVTATFVASCFWFIAKVFETCKAANPCPVGGISTQLILALTLGMASLLVVSLTISALRKPVAFIGFCGVLGGLYLYPTWFWILQEEPVYWLLNTTMYHSLPRYLLVTHWLACAVLSVTVVGWANMRGIHITTTSRKIFHGAVILIYLPGLAWDIDLLFFASALALTIFIGVECIRMLEVPPIGKMIHQSLVLFLDEKDSGNLILTHIYLLVGCSLSIWIFPGDLNKNGFHISMASGVLALGFGDTAASVGGVLLGKHRWPDNNKTLEGTLCATIVQAGATMALYLLLSGISNTPLPEVANCIHVLLASAFCCLLEGTTKQIDNLVLPTYLYIMLIAT